MTSGAHRPVQPVVPQVARRRNARSLQGLQKEAQTGIEKRAEEEGEGCHGRGPRAAIGELIRQAQEELLTD